MTYEELVLVNGTPVWARQQPPSMPMGDPDDEEDELDKQDEEDDAAGDETGDGEEEGRLAGPAAYAPPTQPDQSALVAPLPTWQGPVIPYRIVPSGLQTSD